MHFVNEQDSPARKLVKIAARSPARSMAGPAVTRMDTPISLAMTCANVVLPIPVGHTIKRDRAARRGRGRWIRMLRFSFTRPGDQVSQMARAKRAIERSIVITRLGRH